MSQEIKDELDTEEIKKIKEEIEENKRKLEEEIERAKVKKFKDDVKENKLLKNHHIVTVNSIFFNFLIIFFIICLILILVAFGVSIYLIYHNHTAIGNWLNGFKPSINQTNVINNYVEQPRVDVSSPIDNHYSIPVYINNTVNVRVCNGSVC